MFSAMFLFASLVGVTLWAVTQAGFTNPIYTEHYGPGRYQNTMVWRVGEVENITYNTFGITDTGSYSIALWQQAPAGQQSANLGPIVNEAALPKTNISFDWTVQLYDFNLTYSNVFFFWLFVGNHQGDTNYRRVSSAFFNITDGTDEYAPSSAISAPSSPLTSATTSYTSFTTAPSPIAGISSTNGGATASVTSTSPSSADQSRGQTDSGGLSTGAGVGIGLGVGAGIIGISSIVCTWLFVRYRRRKRAAAKTEDYLPASTTMREYSDSRTHDSSTYAVSNQPPKLSTEQSLQPSIMYQTPNIATELDGGDVAAQELDAQR